MLDRAQKQYPALSRHVAEGGGGGIKSLNKIGM